MFLKTLCKSCHYNCNVVTCNTFKSVRYILVYGALLHSLSSNQTLQYESDDEEMVATVIGALVSDSNLSHSAVPHESCYSHLQTNPALRLLGTSHQTIDYTNMIRSEF